VDRAIALMQQLLVLARQESAHPSTGTRRRIDLLALSEPIVRELQPLAQARSITLTLHGTAPGWVEGDADGLSILLRNLLENAIKYTPDNGRVTLAVQLLDGRPVWAVEDSGPGIPDAQRERMFERFVRGEHQAATGSGLGLSIARAIALRHGARLTLGQSQQLGGLSAQVAFPALPAQ
jgi:two-component system, OmpR family, sensor kinase